MDVLRIVGIIQQRNLYRRVVLLCLQVDGLSDEAGAVSIHIAHELLQSLFGMEYLRLAHVALLVGAQVCQRDGDACVEECQLTHTACHDVIFVCSGGEDGSVRPELLACAALLGLADNLYRVQRLSLLVFLLVYLAVTIDLRNHV